MSFIIMPLTIQKLLLPLVSASFLLILSHLLKRSFMKNSIFCALTEFSLCHFKVWLHWVTIQKLLLPLVSASFLQILSHLLKKSFMEIHFLCSDWVLILSLQSMTLFSQLSKIAASTCFRQFPADFITFTEEIIHGKLHFLCSDWVLVLSLQSMTLVVPVEFLFPWKISICSQRWK